MIVITELGDTAVTLPLALTIILYLAWRRAWRDLLYWLGALGFGMLSVAVVKDMSRTLSTLPATNAYNLPSGHATMSTVIYGMLAVFVASALRPRWRWPVYAVATLIIVAISFSRIYLGAHWLADVTAGLALTTSGVALLAIAYTHHRRLEINGLGLPIAAGLVFLIATLIHVDHQFKTDRDRFVIRRQYTSLALNQWKQNAWKNQAVWRRDLRGEREQPLNLQWAGKLTLIRKELLKHGWRKPLLINAHTALSWFLPKPTLNDLPILPQLNDGQAESLVMTYPEKQGQAFILRLWPTTTRLQPGNVPLWIGTVTSLRLQHLPLITFLRLDARYSPAMTKLQQSLPAALWQNRQRTLPSDNGQRHWSGKVLLLSSPQ